MVLYEVATATPLFQLLHAPHADHEAPFNHQRQGQHVPVAKAAHPTFNTAALPFLAIFPVQTKVSVPRT